MDKICGANTTPHRVKGTEQRAGDDFEVHPRGTAERLRRLGIIGPMAAALLESEASLILECETVNGEWPADAADAREAYETIATIAAHLRALCAPEAPPDPARQPLPIEDSTTAAYPWPGDEDGQ